MRQQFRNFLNSEIPLKERENMNEAYSLDLASGASFLDALAARAAQFAERSERWAELVRQFKAIRSSGDSDDSETAGIL